MPLGTFFGVSYDEITLPLAIDDVFVFCSDGVSEAMNRRSEEFGSARLIEVVRQTRQLTAKDISSRIVEAVEEHRDGFPSNDDTTIVVLKLTQN